MIAAVIALAGVLAIALGSLAGALLWARSLVAARVAAIADKEQAERLQHIAEAQRDAAVELGGKQQEDLADLRRSLSAALARINDLTKEKADAIRKITDATDAAAALDRVFADPGAGVPVAVPGHQGADGHGAPGPDAVRAGQVPGPGGDAPPRAGH